MYTINKNVPMPPMHAPTTPLQEVINQLDVADSFFIPTDKPKSAIVLAHKCALRARIKVTTRQRIEDDVLGVRVWRLG